MSVRVSSSTSNNSKHTHITMASQDPYPQAPRFTSTSGITMPPLSSTAATALAQRGTPATLNMDDIFGDCFFTPEGETVFLSDQPENVRQEFIQSTETNPTNMASQVGNSGNMVPVSRAAGITGTGLDVPGREATVMTATARQLGQPPQRPTVPFQTHPQRDHHMGYIAVPPGVAEPPKAIVPQATATSRDVKKRRVRPDLSKKPSTSYIQRAKP